MTPRITARPDSVMVRTTTVLTGTGFRPRRKLTVYECGARLWIAPQDVCTHGNVVTVRTSRHGRFRIPLQVLVCPLKSKTPARFERTCYIGVSAIDGIGVVKLSAATRITVTGP